YPGDSHPMKTRIAIFRPVRPRHARGRGFTFMELVLGMMVTSLVMAALAALMGAVAAGWRHSGNAQATSNVVAQTHVRMQRLLKGVRQIGAVRNGSVDGSADPQAAALIWKSDANGDYKIQLSEVALLEAEIGGQLTQCRMVSHTIAYPSDWTTAQRNTADGAALTDAELYEDASIDEFRTIAQASAYGQATVVATSIVGAEFRLIDGAAVTRPTLNYLINIQRGSAPETEYGSVTVRTPTTLPAS
ncbi:MAG: hypothetical protein ABIP55_01385, partial [Tepidisphaeraceae bacterium]